MRRKSFAAGDKVALVLRLRDRTEVRFDGVIEDVSDGLVTTLLTCGNRDTMTLSQARKSLVQV